MDIAIEMENKATIDELMQLDGCQNPLATERHGMDGNILFTAIITLTPGIIAGIVSITKAELAARRYVKVSYKGIAIQGISEQALLKIIESETKGGHN
jgi:hypothetical protein